MSRWWKCAAVTAAWLGLAVAAPAQQEIPTPVGAAHMIEPLRYKPEPQPDLVPGPLTPLIAPPGPPDCLALPSGHSSAFQVENYSTESAFYGAAGMLGIQRYHPGNLAVAFSQDGSQALSLRELNPNMDAGIRATVGFLLGNSAVEVSGFYQPAATRTLDVTGLVPIGTPGATRIAFTPQELKANVQGQFSVPFTANGGVLPGFGGVDGAGIWNGADQVRVSYQSQLGSAELTYREWSAADTGFELLLGVRWLGVRERLNIFTDQGALTDARDPLNTANYAASTLNNIVALQFGTEYSCPCPIPNFGWIWFTGMGKAALGPNFVDRDFNLSRGDGFTAFTMHRSNVEVGSIFELSGYLDFHLAERIRLRAGYQALWAVGISNPAVQSSFNLSTPGAKKLDASTGFWSGPVAELELLW